MGIEPMARATYNVLYIEGVKVDLKVWRHQVDGEMTKWWYIQFESGAFEAGSTHNFYMEWWYQGQLLRGIDITVYFTS